MLFNKTYRLSKSRAILKESYVLYKRKAKKLSPSQKESLEKNFTELDEALLEKNREKADELAKKLQQSVKKLLPKTSFDFAVEIIFALIFALIVAGLVRTMWFELYKIPTGSMRPTFEEQDHLIVSKTNFGINVPFQPKHFYFDPNLLERTGVVIFSIDNMDVSNPDTTYFYLFPGKKLLIKRLIGKPGDTLYFYGGKIYGIDKDGNDLKILREAPWLTKIDHVPYLSFDGKVKFAPPQTDKSRSKGEYYFNQMNLPIARLLLKDEGGLKGTIFNGTTWVPDNPDAAKRPHSSIVTYSDIWGMGNYAMGRLLTASQLEQYTDFTRKDLGEGILYLQLFHSPNLVNPAPHFARDERGQIVPLLTPLTTAIPLQKNHLDALMDNLYTARFVVEKGYAFRYEDGGIPSTNFQRGIRMDGVPDGTYEFYYGKGYAVNTFGVLSDLPPNHPLYSRDPERIQTLYNLGIEFNNYFAPSSALPFVYASRFSYFRNGDLYTMGGPLIKSGDPALLSFIAKEQKRQFSSTPLNPYIAFKDHGAPIKDGAIDSEFIKAFGIKVPEKMYLVLGDNYAMSGDSREFGFVPENNIRGGPWTILWPPGSRWFHPVQPEYPWFSTPQLIVWGCIILIVGVGFWIHHKRSQRPVFKK